MPRKAYRKLLSIEEFNAISSYTNALKVDCSFDIYHDEENNIDYFYDFDDSRKKSVHWGIKLLWEATSYPVRCMISKEETNIIINLFREFVDITDENECWCRMTREEYNVYEDIRMEKLIYDSRKEAKI